jgi:hypothetical protein
MNAAAPSTVAHLNADVEHLLSSFKSFQLEEEICCRGRMLRNLDGSTLMSFTKVDVRLEIPQPLLPQLVRRRLCSTCSPPTQLSLMRKPDLARAALTAPAP